MSAPKRFDKTRITTVDGRNVVATVNKEEKACVVYFSYEDDEKPLENEYKGSKKQFSVFIPKEKCDVLRMLSIRKGKIVPHRNNPKQLYLNWERVMKETNITLNGSPLRASYFTKKKRDKIGLYYQSIFCFYTEDGKIVTHKIKEKEKPFTFCFITDNQEEVTDEANCKWLLQEGQIIPHNKYKGSLFLRLGKPPIKTLFQIEVDGKNKPVYASFRVKEKIKDVFVMKMRFYTDNTPIMHHNHKGNHVPFVYSYETNNPEYVTSEAINEWFKTTSGKIVPHDKVEGKLFLQIKK